eukprot:s1385_g47.t1
MALKSFVSNLVSDVQHGPEVLGEQPETVHQGDAAHLDQFDQSLLATRRPKTYVSFHKEEGEEKKEGE